MQGYEGAKTLLPLLPASSPYSGERPILLHILENLPAGPKAVVVNHKKGDIYRATAPFGHHLLPAAPVERHRGRLAGGQAFPGTTGM
jgi:bifunctional UDP-N-acetylglucosamine pyrophosphorylase/glucosamine-1-phosphate N-acetyltransferase